MEERRSALAMALALIAIVAFNSTALAEGLSGWANLNRNTTRQFEDGKKTSDSDIFNRNFYFSFDKSVTPLLSYRLYLRTTFTDSHSTDPLGKMTSVYQRTVEPSIDFFLRNPMYNFDAGYRWQEQWSTAHLRDESRKTTDYYYSRLNVTPYEFPSIMLQFDRQKAYDYASPRKVENTTDRYSANSGYKFPYRDLDLSYNLYYTRTTTDTPLSSTFKSVNDNFSGMYNIGYTKSFKEGKYTASAVYQGNYARNKNQQFVSQTGSVLFERAPYLGGLYLQDTTPDIDALNSQPLLINKNYKTDITGIWLNTTYQNIGIQLTYKKVDRLYIYYKEDVSAGSITWRVYWSDNNLNWNYITETTVSPTYDSINNAYRYEIAFPAATAYYFKAVNPINTVSVEVTEIEAYGTDVVPETGKVVDAVTLFNQGVNFVVNVKPLSKLNFSLTSMVNRTDTNPISPWDSIGAFGGDIFTKSAKNQETTMRSTVTKTYGIASTWVAHRLLSTTAQAQRSETYDNRKETDSASKIYSLAFNSAPLPTLNTNLSFTRSDNFNFGVKQSTNNSALLNIGSKLYRDVNMITDIGFAQSTTHTTNTQSSTRYIRGLLDATLTPKLFGTLTYGFTNTSTGSTTANTQEGGTVITYRPGRFVNVSGTFRISDADGNKSTTEGFLVDWLPLPVIRLNLNYQRSSTEPESATTDALGGYAIWYITKFLDVQLTSAYTRRMNEKKTETYSFGGNLTCRFW
ncbi:MAG: hypothetical protein FP832_01155 [Nitrospirae bacterium]|nr:hypothetical protein [Nitrospirota bacterium]